MNTNLVQHLEERTPGIVVSQLGIQRNMIPYPDSIKMLKMRTINSIVEQGKWVRVRKGRYNGDVGLVIAVNSWEAEVLLVPRLNSSPTHSSMPDSTPSLKRKRTADVSQPALFNPDLSNNTNNAYMEDFFEHGLVRKRFNLYSISSTVTDIPFHLFFLFKRSEHPLVLASTIPRPQEWVFEEHDMVVICSNKKVGSITTIQAMHAKIELANGEGAISVPLHDLRKVFVAGDCVRITSGALKGRTGLVVNVDGDIANIVDNSSEGGTHGDDSIQVFIIRY
jgi:ribosomal protein L24